MTQLLLLKEQIKKIYQKHSSLFNSLFRFLVGFIAFYSADKVVGYHPVLNHIYIEALLALISMILPMEALVFAVAVFVTVHVFYVSRILALSLAVIFLVLYLLYIQFTPKHGYVILMIPVAYALNIFCGVPVLLGLIATPIVILPMTIGVGIYYLITTLTSVIAASTDDSINLFQVLVNQLAGNAELYVTICIFAVVMVVVYVIRNMGKKYSFEIAIVTGILLNTVLALLANYLFAISLDIVRFLIGSLISAILVWIIQFFRLSLNYASVENLQFEDEEYYYYVRAVPKMSVTAQSKRVKRFNAHLFDNGNEPKKQ